MTNEEKPAPIDQLLRLVARAERLEAFPRTGWQVCGVDRPESIASHSYVVALIALWLSDHVDSKVDTERVLRIALVHDLAEAMLTDLPRPVKQLLGKDCWRAAEDRATQRLFSHGLSHWEEAHEEYRTAQTIEARLVKAADRIQMLAKALQYNAEHRGRVERFFADRKAYDHYGIALVEEIFDRLFQWYEEDYWFPADFD